MQCCFPCDVLSHIFSFDSTYREAFKDCIEEMEWRILIQQRLQYDYFFSASISNPLPLSLTTIHGAMTREMYTILPYLQRVGCKPDTFLPHNCFWHVDHEPHRRRNEKVVAKQFAGDTSPAYWKTTIVVNLFVAESNLDLDQWFETALLVERQRHGYEPNNKDGSSLIDGSDDDDDLITEYTYDSHGRYPIRHYHTSNYMCEQFHPVIYESGTCKIYTTNLFDITCIFRGVKIPV